MSELATLARPYASAVFLRAKETASTEQWSEALAFVDAVLKDLSVCKIFDNPKISDDQKTELMLDLCREQQVKDLANFVKLLVQNKRLGLISQIAKLFEEYKAEDEGYVDVDVISAYSMTKEAKAGLVSSLEKTLGKKVRMNAVVDKSLIGGALIRAGDKVIDGSIQGQLQHLQKTLQ
jgi:F-type H+-transporting ATPase subunit delta